ncbi:MAG: hypothetical protein JNL82_16200 [Myxococcales bacterium]|nr:hypothetical protein [Myxococcales bacterium]
MLALVSVLALVLAGPDAASAPLSPTADSKAIFAAIRAGDPTITKPPASLDSLVAATEMAEEKLRQVDDEDEAEDLLTLVVQGRRAAYGRTSDAAHLCSLVAAADHVLALKTSNAASDFRQDAVHDLGAHRCGDESPAPASTPAAPVPPPVITPKPGPPPSRPADRPDRRRVRAGASTLVPGLVLLAPMTALLAVRAGIRDDIADLAAATATRPATAAEDARFARLDDRYGAATAAAAVLGVTGGALIVTGAVLLAAKRRPPRAALAPWGGRGVGGIVLQGRF